MKKMLCIMMYGWVAASVWAQNIDGVAAVVNSEVITFSEIKEELGDLELDLRSKFTGALLVEKVKEARRNALEKLVNDRLIVQAFHKKGYFLSDKVIDERLNRIIEQKYSGNLSSLVKEINQQGLNLEEFRRTLGDGIIIHAMRSKHVYEKIRARTKEVTQEEVNNEKQLWINELRGEAYIKFHF
ncbi:MAG: hypothetical protein HC904_11015 [Blastochloris sp.]|nr:hypothetical protein [Blastochloris sp.]